MHSKYNSVLDDASADWYSYHFNDSILQHDVYWLGWHQVIQNHLSAAQQDGKACALCGTHVADGAEAAEEFVGGFRLVVCNACPAVTEDSIQKTIDDVEGDVDG